MPSLNALLADIAEQARKRNARYERLMKLAVSPTMTVFDQARYAASMIELLPALLDAAADSGSNSFLVFDDCGTCDFNSLRGAVSYLYEWGSKQGIGMSLQRNGQSGKYALSFFWKKDYSW